MKFIEFKGKKHPIHMTMGCLVSYEETIGKDFWECLQGKDSGKEFYDNILTMFHLCLTIGAEYHYSVSRRFLNKLLTGNNYGIKSRNLFKVFDFVFKDFMLLMPHFILEVFGENKPDDGSVKKN